MPAAEAELPVLEEETLEEELEEEEEVPARRAPVQRPRRKKAPRRRDNKLRTLIGLAVLAVAVVVCGALWMRRLLGPDYFAASWAPDAALLDQLDAEAAVSDFTIRPPKGYTRTDAALSAVPTTLWAGPVQADGSRAVLTVIVNNISPRDQDRSEEDHLEDALRGMRVTFPGELTPGAVQRGKINGLDFQRVALKGSAAGKQLSGFLYLAVLENQMVAINVVSPQAETLNVLETSVRTFAKRR